MRRMFSRERKVFLLVLFISFIFGIGTSSAFPESPYKLPYPAGKEYKVTQGNFSQPSHNEKYQEEYAFDFNLKEGDLVVASRSGKVLSIQDKFGKGGDESYKNFVNYVLIDHGDGTSALYLHLLKDSVVVKEGEYVQQGQIIAKAGLSGYIIGAHLHFQVQETPEKVWYDKEKGYNRGWHTQSIPISFSDEDVLAKEPDGIPKEWNPKDEKTWKTYRSDNIQPTIPTAMSKILFLQSEQENSYVLDLLAVNPDGSGVTKVLLAVVSRNIGGYGPNRVVVSPDGKKIAAVTARDSQTNEIISWGDPQIEIIDLDRPEEKKIVPLKEYGMRYWALGHLRWSPDGTKIAFVYQEDIYVINVDGTGFVRLFDNEENYEPFLSWWPDSEKIIFLKKTGKEVWEWQLFIAFLDGRIEPVNLSPDVFAIPVWSPDGRKIAFTGQDTQLWAGDFVNGKVTNTKRLTNNGIDGKAIWYKCWSEDGSKIAFSDFRQEILAVIDCDGSNLKIIQSGSAGLVGWTEISKSDL